MAASQGYRDWLNAGRPYTLIRPATALVRSLQRHGLTVYGLAPPNDAHLKASTPEDHTPYSVTGWPGANRRWLARGVDVMPRSDSLADRRENADIARRLIRDRDAGLPAVMWIKYLNWTDEHGVCRQERWTTAGKPLQRTTKSSTDAGHIHVSGRSDVDDDARADSYDPLAPATTGDDMADIDPATMPHLWHLATRVDALRSMQEVDGLGEAMPLVTAIKGLQAAAVADADRDAAALAAVKALTDVIKAGGGSVDSVAIVAAVKAAGDESRAQYTAQAARIAELEEQLTRAVAAAEANLSQPELDKLNP